MASTQTAKSAVALSNFGGLVKNNLVKSTELSDFFCRWLRPGR